MDKPEKIAFTDPQTKEVISFVVEEKTTLNGINYLLVSEDEDAYILKEVSGDEQDAIYEMVEEDTEFDAIARIFSELLDEDTDLTY